MPRARAASRQTLTLARNLTLREIRSEYNRTALGRLWSLLNPLATIAIFSLVFGLLFRAEPHVGEHSGLHSYALWVACGIIPWAFTSNAISAGMGSLLANSGLLTKVWFPRWVLVASAVAAKCVTFAIELAVVLVIMAIAGFQNALWLLPGIPGLIGVALLNAIFVLGIALVLSVAVVYFRDVQHLWAVWNQIWFYGTGVVFGTELVVQAQRQLTAEGWSLFGMPLPLLTLFELNPAHQFLEAYRSVLYDFALPSWSTWAQMLAWAAAMLLIGVLVFRRYSGRVVEEL